MMRQPILISLSWSLCFAFAQKPPYIIVNQDLKPLSSVFEGISPRPERFAFYLEALKSAGKGTLCVTQRRSSIDLPLSQRLSTNRNQAGSGIPGLMASFMPQGRLRVPAMMQAPCTGGGCWATLEWVECVGTECTRSVCALAVGPSCHYCRGGTYSQACPGCNDMWLCYDPLCDCGV